MSFRKTLLAATVLMAPALAQAQPVTGLYVAGGLGVNFLNRVSDDLTVGAFSDGSAGGTSSVRVNTNTGWAILGSVGWGFGNGLRLEGEANYRSNAVSSVGITGLTPVSSGGSINSYGLMVNALYDFQLGPVMPYVGAGIGYAWNNFSGVSAWGLDGAGNAANVRLNDSTGNFAYQGIVGLAVPIASVPGLAITAEYRYFGILASSLGGSVTRSTVGQGEGATTTGVASGSIKPPSNNNSILFGVRYNFGQARPAAPVAAAPAPARSFLVFFDFGSDQLTARAREIVNQAAQASRSQQVTRIEVAGHTDTVGSAQYNQGLSLRRANNVASELVRLGVPRQNITTAGFGFSRPLVPTGPNVREPQNRRVEIVLR